MAGKEEEAVTDENCPLVDRASDLGNRIRVSLDFLCKNSMNLTQVLVHLLSHGLLQQQESEVVENEKSTYDSFRKLFTLLMPRVGHGENSKHFLDSFQQSGNEHILKQLKTAVATNYFAEPPDTSSRSVRFNVEEPVASFFGRQKFVCDLHEQICQSQRTDDGVSTIISRTCVVTGLGGIGKTETIRKYIHSYGHCYQHVVWIDAEEQNTAENQFRRLALQELKLPSKDIETNAKDFDVILKEIYERLCTSTTLLVFDNAEALDDSDPQRSGVACFLPKCLLPTLIKPAIIITSRQLKWRELLSMPLQLLTTPESKDFLFYQLNLKESDANEKDATTLYETFGGLPLALQVVAAVIREESRQNELLGKDVYTIQHLLSDYSEGKREFLKKRPPGSPDTQPLMFLWKVSLDKIRKQPHGHLANQILNVMAHLSPTNIPKDLLFFIFNSNEDRSLKKAVELLVDYSFVHNSRKHFSIHRVLQDVTLAHLESLTEERPQNWFMNLRIWTFFTSRRRSNETPLLIRITTALRKYWPTVPKSSEAYDAVHDNLVHVTMSHVLPKAQNSSKNDFHFIEFIAFVFNEIDDTRWVEAEKCCRVLIAYFTNSALPSNSASSFKSPNFLKTLNLRRQLARILKMMGRYKEAVDICQDILSSVNSLEDQEDVMEEMLDTKHYLALILDSQGDYEEAIKLNSSVLELLSKLHGPTHKFTLTTKNNLAVALQNSGRLSEDKTLHVEILEVKMKDLGPHHLDTLSSKHNMAVILGREGRYDDALEMLREVVEARERELGPLHVKTLVSNICMAEVLDEQGKDEDALQLYAHVISRYEKASAASHPRCLLVKNNLAAILGKQGKVDEAKEMLCHVLDIQKHLLAPSNPDTLTTKHNVALLLEKQGKHSKALKLYEEVLELKTKQLGPTHPSTLKTNNNIGWLHLKMGNFEKAESILKEVLAARQATLPSNHPDIKETEELYEQARLRNHL